MEKTSSKPFYVLAEGSTHEESLTWEEIKERVKREELSLESMLFDSERNEWVKLSSLEELKPPVSPDEQKETKEPEPDPASKEIEEEYDLTLRRLHEEPDSLDLLLKAGRLALGLEKKHEAIQHYQAALRLQPFSRRIAQEIKRSFRPGDYKRFSLLERKPPWWEDLPDIFVSPLQTNWKKLGIMTACLSPFMFFSWGRIIYWSAMAFLVVQTIRSEDKKHVLSIDFRSLEFSSDVLKPLVSIIGAAAEIFSSFALLAIPAILLEGTDHAGLWAFIIESPILVVSLFTLSALYLPALLIVSADSRSSILDSLNPASVFRVVKTMDVEYLISDAFVVLVSIGLIMLGSAVFAVPVAGKVFMTAARLCCALIVGIMLGRLHSRHAHIMGMGRRSGKGDDGEVKSQAALGL